MDWMTDRQIEEFEALKDRMSKAGMVVGRAIKEMCGTACLVWVGTKANPEQTLYGIERDGYVHT